MRLVLLSDIHGNLPALEAELSDIDRPGDADAIYHLGDLVGYAPWPNEVVEVLKERGIMGVAGNCDSTTANDHKNCGCRYEDPVQEALSHKSYAWTRSNVSLETKRYLRALPFTLDLRPMGGHTPGPRIVLIHGNPVLNTFYWTKLLSSSSGSATIPKRPSEQSKGVRCRTSSRRTLRPEVARRNEPNMWRTTEAAR